MVIPGGGHLAFLGCRGVGGGNSGGSRGGHHRPDDRQGRTILVECEGLAPDKPCWCQRILQLLRCHVDGRGTAAAPRRRRSASAHGRGGVGDERQRGARRRSRAGRVAAERGAERGGLREEHFSKDFRTSHLRMPRGFLSAHSAAASLPRRRFEAISFVKKFPNGSSCRSWRPAWRPT